MAVQTEPFEAISADTEREVDRLFEARRTGKISEETFFNRSGAAINRGNARATVVADKAVAAEKAKQTGEPARPLGIRPENEQKRLEDNSRAVYHKQLEGKKTPAQVDESREARLKRLGRAEPLKTGQNTMQKAMEGQGAEGWTRVVDEDPCDLCLKWDDGRTRPVSTPMNRHVGCACIQQPVFRQQKDRKNLKRAGVGVGVLGVSYLGVRALRKARTIQAPVVIPRQADAPAARKLAFLAVARKARTLRTAAVAARRAQKAVEAANAKRAAQVASAISEFADIDEAIAKKAAEVLAARKKYTALRLTMAQHPTAGTAVMKAQLVKLAEELAKESLELGKLKMVRRSKS